MGEPSLQNTTSKGLRALNRFHNVSPRAAARRATHGKLPRSSTGKNLIATLLTSALVLAASGVAVVSYTVLQVVQQAETFELPAAAAQPVSVDAAAQTLDGELTILLVGSDRRDPDSIMYDGEEGDRNDVNLLLHIPASHESATIISFPRDLMVSIPSCTDPETGETSDSMSSQQINTAIEYGGPGCVAATVTELTGLPIAYAAEVDFDGVIGITNALGGVTVCLAQPIEDDQAGLYLPAGEVSIAGIDALNFVRTRYGVGDGSDVSRISNQQVFMSAMMRQLVSSETLSDPVKLYALAKAGFQNLTLSSSMASVPFLQALASTAVNIDLDRITFVQYPSFASADDVNRLVPDRASAEALMAVVTSGEPFQLAGTGEAAVSADPPAADPAQGEGETPGADGEQPVEPAPPVTLLPENVTGQHAAQTTCSAGRTRY